MTTGTRLLFVSYSHDDLDVATDVITHLRGLDVPGLDLWIDREKIPVGAQWSKEIEDALAAAEMAVLLVSPKFLASSYIMGKEVKWVRKRLQERSLKLVPILAKRCSAPSWLKDLQLRPGMERSLHEIMTSDRSGLDSVLAGIMDEIRKILVPDTEAVVLPDNEERSAPVRDDHGIALLADALLEEVPDDTRRGVAAKLVERIGTTTGLSGAALFNAVRFFVEFQLLGKEEPTSAIALAAALAPPPRGRRPDRVVSELRKRARTADFSSPPVEVNSRFFGRTNERAGLWKKYFDALIGSGAAMERDVASLVPVCMTMGFLSPQFLVAGLLSRFDDDWKPVLDAYQQSIPSSGPGGAFESLQATQWNCWLMWGPSIPVCQCDEWKGVFALQYGYGDENNSIPIIEVVTENGVPKTLGPVVAGLRAEGRSARFAVVTGHLRWGPFFLERYQAVPELRDVDEDELDSGSTQAVYGTAGAQAAMYDRDGDGLVLQLVRLDKSLPETRVYFSAYLWMMFLVAVSAAGPAAAAGPGLLRGKLYPPWPKDPGDRLQMRDARLWEGLLPVFVHANIGDPAALAIQKQILIANAIQLLRQVWQRRAEMFDPRDVEVGIEFHLVCASDYSGCRDEVRFPPAQSLVELLRERLASDADRAFADRVILPASGAAAPPRPWGLAGYFSACHLPEMIANYYDHVRPSSTNDRSRRGAGVDEESGAAGPA